MVRPATMPEHSTRQTSLERLEEAVNKLTQHQATLAQNHQTLTQANADLNSKLDSILDRLATLTTTVLPTYEAWCPAIWWTRSTRLDLQNPTILWLSEGLRCRTPHCGLFLHGRSRVVLVSMDIQERFPDILAGYAPGPGVEIRSVILRRPLWGTFQTPTARHR